MIVSHAKIEFPDTCPGDCPERQTVFFQGNTCYRCPVLNCAKDENGFCLVEPEGYNPEFAREFKSWFDSGFDPKYYPLV